MQHLMNLDIAEMLGWLKVYNGEEIVEVISEDRNPMFDRYELYNYRTLTGKYQFPVDNLLFHSNLIWLFYAKDYICSLGYRFYLSETEEITKVVFTDMSIGSSSEYGGKIIVEFTNKDYFSCLFNAIHEFSVKYNKDKF